MTRSIIVYLDNNDSFATKINGTVDTIVNYYLGKQFTVENKQRKEIQATARAICFLDPIHIPWGENERTVEKIFLVGDEYMRRHQLTNRIRAGFTVHYKATVVDMKMSWAYAPGMFDPY